MQLIRCENGHFYDAATYSTCPHCSGAERANDDRTVGLTQGQAIDNNLTEYLNEIPPQNFSMPTGGGFTGMPITGTPMTANPAAYAPPVSGLAADVQNAAGYTVGAQDGGETVGYYSQAIGIEPVVGWLVCIEGACLGQDFRLKTGRNFVGRSPEMDVLITGDDSVSRDRHAIIVYEPKTYLTLIQAGDSKELSYLNDRVVLNPEELKPNDIITVGNTKLMFFPCCGEKFNWEMIQTVYTS